MATVVVFVVDGQRYGLPLECVERVLRAVRVTPLPRAPAGVAGAIDVHGIVVPVFDVRARLALPPKPLTPSDCLVLARRGERIVAILADAVMGAESCAASEMVEADAIVAGLDGVMGVVRTPDGLILIHDLHRFLSPEEDRVLDDALDGA